MCPTNLVKTDGKTHLMFKYVTFHTSLLFSDGYYKNLEALCTVCSCLNNVFIFVYIASRYRTFEAVCVVVFPILIQRHGRQVQDELRQSCLSS